MIKIKHIIYLSALLLLTNTACSEMDDFYLSGTVFIEDPFFPGLPEYSEWGYNTFGAYIDREPFVSTNDDLPVKVIVNSDTLHMILRGRMGSQDVDLTFSIKGFSPGKYYDLTVLDGIVIDLDQPGRSVSMKLGDEVLDLKLIEGELDFSRVQRLYVDEEMSRAIMSGHFQLKTFLYGEPISISNGRFDLGIGYENFYNY